MRQAIEELARKQLVVRKQGKGTFVTKPAVKHDLRRLHGLLASLFAQSDAASTELLRYELATPPRQHCPGAEPQTRAVRFGARPALPDRRPPGRVRAGLARARGGGDCRARKADLISTEDMMRAAGIRIASSQVSIRAEAAGTAVGRLLAAAGARAGAGAAAQRARRRRRREGSEPRLVLLRRLRAGLHRKSRRKRLRHPSQRLRPYAHRGSTHEISPRSRTGRASCAIATRSSRQRATRKARRSRCASRCSRRRW